MTKTLGIRRFNIPHAHPRRRYSRIFLLGMLASCLSPLAFSQKPVTFNAPPSDPQALSVVNAALAAMGGQTALSAIADSTATGSCVVVSAGGDSTQVSGGSSPQGRPFRWINSGKEFRYEGNTQTSTNVMVSAQGKPSAYDQSGAHPLTTETAMILAQPYYLPGQMLLKVTKDPTFNLSIVGQETVNGVSTTHIRATKFVMGIPLKGFTQDWWIDSSTLLPVQLGYVIPGQSVLNTYLHHVKRYSQWSLEAGGVLVPHRINSGSNTASEFNSCGIDTLQINTQPAASLFAGR